MAFNLCLHYFAALIKAMQDKKYWMKGNAHNVNEKKDSRNICTYIFI